MFSGIFNFGAVNLSQEKLSPEDAALVKTLLIFKDEFQEQQNAVVMSLDGLKTVTNIDFSNKFKGILWTGDINQKLPIKCTEYP